MDFTQSILLIVSIFFLISQGFYAYKFGDIKPRYMKFLFTNIALKPKVKFKYKAQKQTYYCLVIMFIISFLLFGFYSAIK